MNRNKLVNGKRVKLTPTENSIRDADEVSAAIEMEKYAAKAVERDLKRSGVKLGNIMASATRSDQDGLAAISVGVMMARGAGTTFPDTNFEFVNGAELLITDSNFNDYFAIWSAFRQSFFKPGDA
jgi:hypothetical protein